MDLKTLENNHQEWLIDDFVEVANRLLPLYLPDIKGNNKVKEIFNNRLVRSYTTSGLIDEPIRQNRYAFYTYRHLLQLLLVKRLLSDGIGTAAIADLLTSKTNEELKSLLIGGIQIHITTAHPSLTQISQDFGSNLKTTTNQNKSSNATTTTNQDSNSNSALDFLADLKGKRSQSPSTLRAKIKRDNFQSSNQDKDTMSALDHDNDNDMSALDETYNHQNLLDKEESWTRLRVLEGLELHIRDDFVYPNSIKERESLMEYLSNIFSRRCRQSDDSL